MRIEAEHPGLLAEGAPGAEVRAHSSTPKAPAGSESKPHVCRTQGLPLRWLEEGDDWDFVERRDICPLNAEGPALEELTEPQCWEIGPVEDRLSLAKEALDGGAMRRVGLRTLFRRA